MSKDSKMQKGWCWCSKCEALFFVETEWMSYCPAGGEHDETFYSSFSYSINLEKPGDSDWRRCVRCQVLFVDSGSLMLVIPGKCPAPGTVFMGDVHQADYTVKYFIKKNLNDSDEQQGWRRCIKCRVLFYSGHATQGKCQAGGTHDSSNSGNFSVYVE